MDFRLPWSELDPRRRPPLDVEDARKPALAALRRKPGRTSSGRDLAERELRFLLWSHLGAWSSGWSDPTSAGGPNRIWKGADSVADDDDATAHRVISALEDWQGWLVQLADAFEPIAGATKELDEVDAVARAASDVLALVLERTGGQGDWARTFATATSWCVQACGRANEDLTELIATAIGDRFERGAAPSAELAQEVVEELALEVAVRERAPFCEDALETWWQVRASAPWGSPSPPDYRPTEGDAHRLFIRTHDRPRSGVRADAMTRALVRARWGAKQKLKLDLGLLKEWLELALMNSDFAVRKNDCFSEDKGERYGRPKDLEKRLAQALADATNEATPPISRAARVYMDLSVLCPFTVGNARIARLTFDHVLARDGLGLHDATPVFTVRRWAHDKGEPWRFQKVLAACVGPGVT
ncbi:MAG: Fic family protein [Sandaracinaceae bacterium]|nr:Fic family protein [Sandaracinaceae bacterium]